jgi:hypothetical protein
MVVEAFDCRYFEVVFGFRLKTWGKSLPALDSLSLDLELKVFAAAKLDLLS